MQPCGFLTYSIEASKLCANFMTPLFQAAKAHARERKKKKKKTLKMLHSDTHHASFSAGYKYFTFFSYKRWPCTTSRVMKLAEISACRAI